MSKYVLILNNFWWKVTALLIAIAIWIGFHTKDELQLFPQAVHPGFSTREIVSHPLTITKPANDVREFRVTPTEVDITISGDLKLLKKLDARKIKATVELSDFSQTNNILPINVTVPPEFKLEHVLPEQAQVEMTNR